MAGHIEVEASTPPRNSSNKGNLNITVSEAHRTEEKQSKKIVREAKQVLAYHDSTFADQFNALRVLIFVTLEHPRSSRLAWYISLFLVACILLNSLAFIISTIPSLFRYPTSCANPVCTPGPDTACTKVICPPEDNHVIWWLELVTIAIFTVDYLLRVLCVPPVPVDLVFPRSLEYTIDGKLKDRSRYYRMTTWRKVTKYMMSGLNIIDLVSIIPYYISLFVGQQIPFLRMLRFLRFLLIFKLGRRFREAGAIIARTLRASLPAMLIFLFLTTVMAVTFGSVMYFFEGGVFSVTPEFPAGGFLRPSTRNTGLEKSPFVSIITGIYWYVVNTTTLGNTALYPTTTGGRIASCFIAYCGLLSLALPITIIGQNFSQQYNLVYVDPDTHPHLFYPPTPRTPRTPKAGGSQTPRRKGAAPGTRDGFKGPREDLNYVSPEQEIEALRAEFQQQIDALRNHMGSTAAASAGPSQQQQQEVDALRAYVQREIGNMKMTMNGANGTQGPGQQQYQQQYQQQGQGQQQGGREGGREGGYGRVSSEDGDSTMGTRSFSMGGGREEGRESSWRERERESAETLRQRQREEEEERENQAQRSLREAEINTFRNQITEGIRRFSPQAELETFRGGLY